MAQHGHIQKIVRFFGERFANTAEPGSWAGVPSEFVQGGAREKDSGASSTMNTNDQSAMPTSVPNRGGEGPVIAVGIAPDSPIAECNLHIGNYEYHRVGVGCPFVGSISDWNSVRISPARSIPALYKVSDTVFPTTAQYKTWVIPWEMDSFEEFFLAGAATNVAMPKPPIKLNLYRGNIAALVGAVQKRSGYHAEMSWHIRDVTNKLSLLVITDGRRRVRVRAARKEVADGGQAASIRVVGVESYKSANGICPNEVTDGRIDIPVFDELLPITALPDNRQVETILDWTGNPYFAFTATITGTVGAVGHVSIDCWDD